MEGSQERRDTFRLECGNTLRWNAYLNTNGKEDEHDDQDDYWSGASLQGASRDATDTGLAQCMPGGWNSNSTEDEEPHSH